MRNIGKHHGVYSPYTCTCKSALELLPHAGLNWQVHNSTQHCQKCSWIYDISAKAQDHREQVVVLYSNLNHVNTHPWNPWPSEPKNMYHSVWSDEINRRNGIQSYSRSNSSWTQLTNKQLRVFVLLAFNRVMLSRECVAGRLLRTSTNSHDKMHGGIVNLNTSMSPSS